MSKHYKVYQSHAPSGGISPVNDIEYATIEEARGAAEAMASETEVSYTHDFGGGNITTYPSFWAQSIGIDSNGFFRFDLG
tara:strand:- start:8128 stop:8367 length:240 start_codon:yes stop_codon:yes gene_type:complete